MAGLKLTRLEQAVLQAIYARYPTERAALEAQLAAATVRSRKNTGAGFYTYFDVNRIAAAAAQCERVIGNVSVKIEGFEDPMVFVLFIEDGYANCLEGAAIRDDTAQTDFGAVEFEIIGSSS